MAKKQTRRSISVSGDTYNAVRDYCDLHNLSASGLVTDLLNKYIKDHADGPDPISEVEPDTENVLPETGSDAEAPKSYRIPSTARIGHPQAAGDMSYPDRRGPGFTPLPEGTTMANWLVTAEISISRKRQIDAQTAVVTLLHNLIHRRMVNDAQVTKILFLNEE